MNLDEKVKLAYKLGSYNFKSLLADETNKNLNESIEEYKRDYDEDLEAMPPHHNAFYLIGWIDCLKHYKEILDLKCVVVGDDMDEICKFIKKGDEHVL
tara:strand:+ start:442 stop:735 length:294 start_codon:yes stop_codon:yes gene_type:complete